MWRTFPVRRTADERIFLAVFFLYIKKYATWCPLSQQNDCANLDRWIDIQRLSRFFSLFFLEPPKPNQRRRDRLLPPPTAGCDLPRLLFVPVRGLTIVLRLGSLSAALPSGVFNMVNNREE